MEKKFYEVWINDKFIYRYTTMEEAQARLMKETGEEKEVRIR